MFKKLLLVAATAAIALPLVTAGGSAAEARTEQLYAQSMQLKAPTKRPDQPAPGRAKPMDGLGSKYIDLAGEYLNPQIQEGQPGSHFCSSVPGNGRSGHVQIVVRNKGNALATPVKVSFLFSTGQFMTETIPLIQPGAAKGAAVAIPDSAWKNGKAQFQISIDPTDIIGETNESNNTFHSFCTDPNA
ncbi:MAG: CARDB domain-containing protein [Kiloniellaceae bacterium]